MKIKDLRAHLQAEEFGPEYADVIESQAQLCIRFDAIPTDESELPLGCSKLGGSPDLPVGIPWPLHGERPLIFLAQLNLKDLNPYSFCRALPSEGILYFFVGAELWAEEYDPSDRRNWRVIYHPGPQEELERRGLPEGELTPQRFNPCRIVFREALSPGSCQIPIHALHLDEVQEDTYMDIIANLPGETDHQVLGLPGRIEEIHYAIQLECQFLSNGISIGEDGKPVDEAKAKELAPGAADWKLLLQLDSDEGAGMDWGDSMISFWIRERDLQNRNFSEAWMIEEWF